MSKMSLNLKKEIIFAFLSTRTRFLSRILLTLPIVVTKAKSDKKLLSYNYKSHRGNIICDFKLLNDQDIDQHRL